MALTCQDSPGKIPEKFPNLSHYFVCLPSSMSSPPPFHPPKTQKGETSACSPQLRTATELKKKKKEKRNAVKIWCGKNRKK